MKIFKVFIIFGLLCCIAFTFIHQHITQVTFYPGNENNTIKSSNTAHRVLLICTVPNMGGVEIHSFNLYKTLIKKGIPAIFLTAHNALIKQKLLDAQLPFYTCNNFKISYKFGNKYTSHQPGLEKAIAQLCKKHSITIIHCNKAQETSAARKIAQHCSAKVFYTHHVPCPEPLHFLEVIDGLIGVNQAIAEMFSEKKDKHQLNHQQVTCIYPFFDQEKFLTFTPTTSRTMFFQKNFNITLQENVPLIVLIGHFYHDGRKNHTLLIKAAHELINRNKKLIQIVFVGNENGSASGYQNLLACKKLVEEYGLTNHIHFLGSTLQIPEILFYSDINVLPSLEDAFGIAALEGAFMKKPTIVSNAIGAAKTLIIDHKTGLLFENNKMESLVEKIEFFLENPKVATIYGENAYHHALKEYSNQAKLEKLLNFYDQVAQQKT